MATLRHLPLNGARSYRLAIIAPGTPHYENVWASTSDKREPNFPFCDIKTPILFVLVVPNIFINCHIIGHLRHATKLIVV